MSLLKANVRTLKWLKEAVTLAEESGKECQVMLALSG